MARIPGLSYQGGLLYEYDDVLLTYFMNPYGNADLIALTGWNNTEKTHQELFDDQDQLVTFVHTVGDWVGDPHKLPVAVLNTSGVINGSNLNWLKTYVNYTPIINYKGQDEYAKDQMTDNGDGTHYIDAPYNISEGTVFSVTGLTERWFFPSNGPFDITYTQTIDYTDSTTGNDAEQFSDNILYKEVEIVDPTNSAVELYTYGDPKSSLNKSTIVTRVDGVDTYAVSATEAIAGVKPNWQEVDDETTQPLYVSNLDGGFGLTRDSGVNTRFTRQNNGISDRPEMTNDEFTIVMEVTLSDQGLPNSFEYGITNIENVLGLLAVPFGGGWRFRVDPKGSAKTDTTVTIATNTLVTTITTFNVTTGEVTFKDSEGGEIVFSGFVRGTNTTDTHNLFDKFGIEKDFKGIIHRYYLLPSIISAQSDIDNIFAQTVRDYGTPPP